MDVRLSMQDVREWSERFSNRGRWGDDDRRGTLNFISRERVLDACALPRTGQIVSCALPFDEDQMRADAARRESVGASTSARGCDSATGSEEPSSTPPEPPGSVTQWNIRAQISPGDDAHDTDDSTLAGESGVLVESIDRLTNGVVGRGILLDLPRIAGRPWLDDGTRIFPSDLDACAERSGVTVQPGDIVLVRTGKLDRTRGRDWGGYANGAAPGLSVHCAGWLHDRQVAAVATDTPYVEVVPGEVEQCTLPLHLIAMRSMGLLLGKAFWLDDLARACAEDGTYEFLFAAPPLPIASYGSPINPLAIR